MTIDKKSLAAFGLRLMGFVSVCGGLAMIGAYVALLAEGTFSPILWPTR
jgi:hypothetical protein